MFEHIMPACLVRSLVINMCNARMCGWLSERRITNVSCKHNKLVRRNVCCMYMWVYVHAHIYSYIDCGYPHLAVRESEQQRLDDV